ncbi:lytic polysaccharide monooxygenase [Actinomadura sp. J1-007]|uniref:lytic polysaccharide monooxygenase n=1 Tax=Actinomadura sp. J1-007 TaxID=2661913 RepID=UPI0028158A77|nr:lytic polysaccharide monooxygenase [Actinomadura sp. J1-007]
MSRKTSLALAAAAAVALPIAVAAPAFSHGYTQSPASRSYLCGTHQVKNCGQVQWDPDGVEGPKGFPSGVRATAASAPGPTGAGRRSTTSAAAPAGPRPR